MADQTADGGSAEIETSCRLDARWRIELPGREPYEFDEERRKAPTWALGGLMGGGRRWYKVRVAPSYGLMDGVAFPCFVDPGDPHRIWIDWDAAYEAHSEAWGRHARVEREVARRENAWEYAVERVMNPFAGRLKDGELELAERTHQRAQGGGGRAGARGARGGRGRDVAQGFTTSKEETDEIKRSAEEFKRIHRTGRKTTATVVGQRRPGRRLGPIAAIEITFDVDDGGTAARPLRAPLRTARGQALQARAHRHGVDRPGRSGRDLPRALKAATACLRARPRVVLAGSHQLLTSERGCR